MQNESAGARNSLGDHRANPALEMLFHKEDMQTWGWVSSLLTPSMKTDKSLGDLSVKCIKEGQQEFTQAQVV